MSGLDAFGIFEIDFQFITTGGYRLGRVKTI